MVVTIQQEVNAFLFVCLFYDLYIAFAQSLKCRAKHSKGISCRSTRRRLDDDDDGVDQAWAMFQQENLAPSEATFDTCDSDMLSAEETDNDCDDDQDAPSQPVPSRAQCREHIDRLRWFLLNHQEADNRQLLDKLDAIDAFIDMQSLASLKQS